MSHLNMFYGTECEHCAKMEKLVKKLEQEKNIKVNRFEVWHDKDNRKTMEELDIEPCGICN
jgi:predicted DCC family thiol-disulfide oxidoreductase YuxK